MFSSAEQEERHKARTRDPSGATSSGLFTVSHKQRLQIGINQDPTLIAELNGKGIRHHHVTVQGEPSPSLIDEIVQLWHGKPIHVVVGIGGGSVLDAAKAIAALLPCGDSVMDYLEDVGHGLTYRGPSLPLIAIPSTAGMGSEATKNAVLSKHGDGGYKKSFRHEMMVAKIAIVDPDLLDGCPAHLVAAQGMDTFTQLLESYVSLRANPFTDALAWSGLEAVAGGGPGNNLFSFEIRNCSVGVSIKNLSLTFSPQGSIQPSLKNCDKAL